MLSPQETPLLQRSPGLPLGALRVRPHPQSRDQVPAPVWPWGSVQSWRAQACVCFCSQGCREQESALETAPWFRRASQMVIVLESTCQCRRREKHRFDPWVRQIPGRRKGGLPYSSGGKESACSAGDAGSIPGSGRSPGEGNGNPLQYSCLGNPMEEEPVGLKSMGSQRLGQDYTTNTHTHPQ